MSRILVAGAGGLLGREVVAGLVGRGHEVVALLNRSSLPRPLADRVEIARVDLLRQNGLAAALRGVDTVFSAAGASVGMGLRGRAGYDRVDVPMNLALLEAAKAAGVRKMTYVAVACSDRLGHTTYVRAHEDVVRAIRSSGLASSFVRPTGFFGALTVFVDLARMRVLPDIGGGRTRTNPIHEKDLADACVEAIEEDAGELEVGGPDVLTRRELLELAMRVANVRALCVPVPTWLAKINVALMYPLHPRISQFGAFATALAEHDVVANVRGKRRLEDYLAAYAAARA